MKITRDAQIFYPPRFVASLSRRVFPLTRKELLPRGVQNKKKKFSIKLNDLSYLAHDGHGRIAFTRHDGRVNKWERKTRIR